MIALNDVLHGTENTDEPIKNSAIKRALEAARAHLGMEVAYVSEFVGNDSVFREVDAPGQEDLIKRGDAHSLDDVYCKHILEGRLPAVIPDTSQEPVAMALPITQATPIGAHMSVPITLRDGRTYGMFCCLSTTPDPSLTERDLQVMRAFADMTAHQISEDVQSEEEFARKRQSVIETIETNAFKPVFQPIWDFAAQSISGFECLTRFAAEPYRTPDVWFGEAADVGLGVELELAAIRAALPHSQALRAEAYIAFNASPQAILDEKFAETFGDVDLSQIVLEITEHAPMGDHEAVLAVLAPLRERGLRLAIDDAGAGHSGLQRIVELRPDIIKLDMSLTRDVDSKPALRALAAALIFFARETGCRIIAEGIETPEELQTLKILGVNKGQGYLLGRPVSAELAADLLGSGRTMGGAMALRSA